MNPIAGLEQACVQLFHEVDDMSAFAHMETHLILKILGGSALAIFVLWLLWRWFAPRDPLEAASSVLKDRLFSSIKKPWDD